MSSSKTTHYQLHQWQPQDQVLREEFNQNFSRLDTALGERIVTGSYVGDWAETQTIQLDVTPTAVLVVPTFPQLLNGSIVRGGLAVRDAPVKVNVVVALEIVEGGFQVHYVTQDGHAAQTNDRGYVYHYLAVV